RSIEIEALRSVRQEAWEGSLPSGARVVSRSQEVHHSEHVQVGTRRVKVGRRDLGNGFFQDVYEDRPVYQDRPVYRQKVRFDADSGQVVRPPRASGSDRAPRGPDAAKSGGEREGRHSESYVVLLRDGRPYRFELPQARWESLREGERLHAVIQGGAV